MNLKQNTIAGLVIGIWAVILAVLLGIFGVKEMWPAFLVMLLFFELGGDPQNLVKIIGGAAFGLILGWLFIKICYLLAPSMGLQTTVLLLIFVFVLVLIALKDVVPAIFNNYAMLYWSVALVFTTQKTGTWLITMLAGGLFVVGGILLTLHILHKPETE